LGYGMALAQLAGLTAVYKSRWPFLYQLASSNEVELQYLIASELNFTRRFALSKWVIAPIGAYPQRVLNLIKKEWPSKVTILLQKEPKTWSADNASYRKVVIDPFFGDEIVRAIEKSKHLERKVIESSEYDSVFNYLFPAIWRDGKKFEEIIIEVSAAPRSFMVAAQNVGMCFENVVVTYVRPTKPREFSPEAFANHLKDPGQDPVRLPYPTISIKPFQNPKRLHSKILSYLLTLEREHKLPTQGVPTKDIAKALGLEGDRKTASTQTVNSLIANGFLRLVDESGKSKWVDFTPFGLSFASALSELKK